MLTSDTLIHGRYRVLERVGNGGMGTVYRVLDTRLQHEVALKHMLASPAPQQAEAFRREAQLLARLRHSALPKVHDYFIEPHGHFLVMEYIAGQDLAALLLSGADAFAVDRVLGWADRLLEALTYLHTQRPPVIHRDIKPQNLKLTDADQIMLLDFGLAKGSLNSFAPELSGVSVFGYTLQYAPLEQIQGAGTDARSDLYALAATLYHLLAGAPPPNAPARASSLLGGHADPLPPLSAYNPRLPQAVDAALRRALAIRAEERFASAAELQAALRRAEPPGAPSQLVQAARVAEPAADLAVAARPVVPEAVSEPAQSQPRRAKGRRGLLFYALPVFSALLLLGLALAIIGNRPRLIGGAVLTYLIITGTVALYDRASRHRYTAPLGAHPDTVQAVAFAPSGRLVGSAAADGSILLWRLGGGLQAACSGHRAPVRQLCFTPDGGTLISGSDDGTVRLWRARDGAALHTLGGHAGGVCQIALSPDGALLASAANDQLAQIFRVRDGERLHTLRGHSEPVLGVAFAPDGGLLATAGEDGLARIWRVRDGQPLSLLAGHAGAVCGVAFSPDGRTLASCSRDGTVRLWRVRDGAHLRTLGAHTRPVGGLAFHPSGELLASRSEDATVRLWRVRDGELLQTLGEHERSVCSAIAFVQGGDTLAAAAWDGSVRLWRVRDGQPQARLTGHSSRILALDAHPDGQLLVTGGLDRAVRVWPV